MNVVLLIVALAVFLALWMAMAWAVAVRTVNNGWIDGLWSFGVGLAGVVAALVPLDANGPSARALLAAALVAVWSLRLGTHIVRRTLKGSDDPRYAELKRQWGDSWKRQLLIFLEVQALCGFVLVLAVLVAAHNPGPLGPFDGLGVIVALAALIGEAISDAQLTAFRADPRHKGKVCDTGLWSLSRHPNYFFEWLYWCAYPLVAIGSGWWWVSLGAPILMYLLLRHVSGVPPLEAHMLRSRPEAFRAYQERVNAFWPIPKG
jgi:steroid 5-alpha reductase family enzyme